MRHGLELAALDARCDDGKAPDTPAVSALADGLHSCGLGSDDAKPVRQPPGLAWRPESWRWACICWPLLAHELERVLRTQASKQTRAQKRRGARAAEEAEREARIAEEQASLGESDRAAEARELQALLDPLGLAVRNIPVRPGSSGLCALHARYAAGNRLTVPLPRQADGNCLYRAVEDQLLQCGAASEAAGGYPVLRARVAAHLRKHAADYAPFVLPVRCRCKWGCC